MRTYTPRMSTYLFRTVSVGKEPRLMAWDHYSKEQAQQDMERRGYVIINYLGEESQ